MMVRLVMGWVCWAATAAAAVGGEALVDLAKQAFGDAKMVDGGQAIRLDMGTRRVNWNNARWAVVELEQPRDLRAVEAIRVVAGSPRVRDDAGVYLALREADGTWYAHGWAADLSAKENVGLARLADFRLCEWYTPAGGTQHDENSVLDLDKIAAVAIGCVNPLGIGEVQFVLKELSLVQRAGPAAKAAVAVDVTGRLLEVNGARTVPAGLFGTFAQRAKGNERKYRMAMQRQLFGTPGGGDEITHMQVHCWGERTQSSVRLKADWAQQCAETARKWAAAAKAAGKPLYAEFWNEPYLNWANNNRINFDPRFYDESRAAEGGPVHIKHDGQIAPHLKWTKKFDAPPWNWCRSGQEWRRGRDEKGNVYSPVHAMPYNRRNWQPALHPPDDVKDGQKYTVQSRGKDVELTAFTPWHVYDETQFTYWSGAGMLKMYVEPMEAFGKALKEAMPASTFYAGWGFRPSEDHWAGWRMLYKPTLDAGIAYIDGVHDHDYGSDPLKMPANYEVVQAYAVTRHNKPLSFLNTEQGAQTDPQAYPKAAEMTGEAYADLNKYRWSIRKMLSMLRDVPDKAVGLAHFGHWWSDSGQGVMFQMLMNLRGRLVQVACDDPSLYAVASIDGTDPANPRPKEMPQRKELVVALLNGHVSPREVKLTVAAPRGAKFQQSATLRRMAVDKATGRPAMVQAEAKWSGTDSSYTLREELGPHEAVAVTLPLTGEVGEASEAVRKQFFGRAILAEVKPGSAVSESIAVDAAVLGKARRAWIKIVAERLGEGEGVVKVNGKAHALPACVTPENCPWIRRLAIDPAELKAANEVIFEAAAGRAGYLLAMNSIVVECE